MTTPSSGRHFINLTSHPFRKRWYLIGCISTQEITMTTRPAFTQRQLTVFTNSTFSSVALMTFHGAFSFSSIETIEHIRREQTMPITLTTVPHPLHFWIWWLDGQFLSGHTRCGLWRDSQVHLDPGFLEDSSVLTVCCPLVTQHLTKNDIIRGFPKVDHSGRSARIVLEQINSAKKTSNRT